MINNEMWLFESAKNGTILDFWDPIADKVPLSSWGYERTIQATSIIDLCLGTRDDCQIHPKGINISGARITGTLDLTAMIIEFPLNLQHCWFDNALVLEGATVTAVRLTGSHVPGVNAEGLVAKHSLHLDEGFKCEGEFLLRDGNIAGSIRCERTTFSHPGQNAFTGTRLKVSGGLFVENSQIFGQLRLIDAQIGGSFSCRGSRVENPGHDAIAAARAVIKGGVMLNKQLGESAEGAIGFSASGRIILSMMQINGSLEMQGAILDNGTKEALLANGVTIGGALLLKAGFRAQGIIDISHSHIGATVECTEASILNPDSMSIKANEITTGGSFILGTKFEANGLISLRGANIGGEFICGGGSYISKTFSIDATRLIVRQGVFLQRGFAATGCVRLVGARVGGNVEMAGIKLLGSKLGKFKMALDASRISVAGSVHLDAPMDFQGGFWLHSAKIGLEFWSKGCHISNEGGIAFNAWNLSTGADLRLDKAVLTGSLWLKNATIGADLRLSEVAIRKDYESWSMNASGMTVKGELVWRQMRIDPDGLIDLTNAKTGQLSDDLQSWHPRGRLKMENFVYSNFTTAGFPVRLRLKWLQRQEAFSVQPYEQVIKVLRQLGRDREARFVARHKLDDLRRRGNLSWAAWLANLFLSLTIGQGYQVWRLLVFAGLVIGIGTYEFSDVGPSAALISTKAAKEYCPKFDPLLYSADAFLPIVDLHQKTYWLPNPTFANYDHVMRYLRIHIFLGWLLTSLAVAGLAGIVKKD